MKGHSKKMYGGKVPANFGSLSMPANRHATLAGTNRPIPQYAHRVIPFGPMGGSKMK